MTENETGEPDPFTAGRCPCGGSLHDGETICEACRRRASDARLHIIAQAVAAEIRRRRFYGTGSDRDSSRALPLPDRSFSGKTSANRLGGA